MKKSRENKDISTMHKSFVSSKNATDGITLIALAITIIVLLILAGVTITTLAGENGILMKTEEAEFKNDIATFQEDLRLSIYNDYIEKNGQRTNSDYFNANRYEEIVKIIPSFKKKYENKIAVKDDQIVYIGLDETERKWLLESEVYVAKKLTINYVDTAGNKLVETYTTSVPNLKYSVKSPEIEGYMPIKDIVEGEIVEDTEINVEYYAICNDLAFAGLDASGNETTNEEDIVTYTVTGIGNCNNSKIAIPREYKGKLVTKIKSYAFNENKNITGIIISETIDKVESFAFYKCSNLIDVRINAKTIGNRAFRLAGVQNAEIGKNVAKTEDLIFENCYNLVNAKIYSEDINITANDFLTCYKLEKININEDNNSYREIDGLMYSKDETKIICCPPGKGGEFIIQSSVKEIGDKAFYYNRYITKVIIPKTVEQIGFLSFGYCSKLTNIEVDAKIIGNRAFRGCPVQNVVIGKNTIETKGLVFEDCSKLLDLKIYSEEIDINGFDFLNCKSLVKITVNEDNNSYQEINGVIYSKDGTVIKCFPQAKGEEFTISTDIKEIGKYAFYRSINLVTIYYEGTIEQWNNMHKGLGWNQNSSIKTIICSDGEISL